MCAYRVPGLADEVSPELAAAWNQRIERAFDDLGELAAESWLIRSPTAIGAGLETDAVKWPGNPAEPRFCLDAEWAEKLSNWGVKGRHECHNEYLEFGLVHRTDAAGNLRPKRFVATTELREYWVTLAMADPQKLAEAATDVLGRTPSWREFYGDDVGDPAALSPREREVRFSLYVAGSGHDRSLPSEIGLNPIGDLNRRDVLFMSHPINGLDDLIYIVAFGAYPYAVDDGGSAKRRATLEEIFIAQGVTHLACRNADPGAARGAFDQVYNPQSPEPRGRRLAFADPLGMYIRSFRSAGLTYRGEAIPQSWIALRRGGQRLEIGPPDTDEAFLDEIMVEEGTDSFPLRGGYELARNIEVGPTIFLGEEVPVAPEALRIIPASEQRLDCREAEVCGRMRQLKAEYERQEPGLRGGGW